MSSGEELFVEFPTSYSLESAAVLLKGFVSQLLYMRQQTHCMLADLQREVEEGRTSGAAGPGPRRLTAVQKKAAKLVDGIDEWCTCIDTCFLTHGVHDAYVVFGANVLQPKELYHLTFNHDGSSGDDGDGRTFLRTLLRTLVIDAADVCTSPMGPTKVHLLVSAPRGTRMPSFLPKPKFRPISRGQTVRIVLGAAALRGEISDESSDTEHMDGSACGTSLDGDPPTDAEEQEDIVEDTQPSFTFAKHGSATKDTSPQSAEDGRASADEAAATLAKTATTPAFTMVAKKAVPPQAGFSFVAPSARSPVASARGALSPSLSDGAKELTFYHCTTVLQGLKPSV